MRYRAWLPGVLAKYSVSEERICLTFDDGPLPGPTEKVLDLLDRRGHRATFFVIGAKCKPSDALRTLKETHLRGHEIGNHTWNHRCASVLKREDFAKEVDLLDRKLREFLGITAPILFRPPRGIMTASLWRHLRNKNLLPVKWTVGPPIAEHRCNPEWMVASYRKAKIRGGDIVLLHDDSPRIMETLPRVLDMIEATGLRSTTLSGSAEQAPTRSKQTTRRTAVGLVPLRVPLGRSESAPSV
jgi:peptidoglycan-N-acetylglucosamine deacetylase